MGVLFNTKAFSSVVVSNNYNEYLIVYKLFACLTKYHMIFIWEWFIKMKVIHISLHTCFANTKIHQ